MSDVQVVRTLWTCMLLCTLAAGCSSSTTRLDAVDREHPLMRRAIQREQSGDLDEAVALYRRLVVEQPRMASAHLSLALLLHDYQQDYVGAIYHYRAYLILRPETEKAALLRDRQRMAERLLAAQLARRPPEDGVAGLDAHAVTQLQSMSQRIARGQTELDALRATNSALERRVLALTRENERLERRLTLLLEPPGTGAIGTGPSVRDLVSGIENAAPRTYEVRPGDNLSRIAERVYGDASQWRRIRDANRDKIDGQDRVLPGQILTIP